MHDIALMLQNLNPEMTRRIGATILLAVAVFFLIVIVLVMVPCWFILKKAGFSPWLSLLCIFPSLGTLVILYILAFAEWKVVPAPLLAVAAPPPYPQPPTPPQV